MFLAGEKELALRGVFYKIIASKGFILLQIEYVNRLDLKRSSQIRKVLGPIYDEETIADIINRYQGIINPVYQASSEFKNFIKEIRDLEWGIRKLEDPLSLRAKCQPDPIVVTINDIADELASNFDYLSTHIMRSAGHVLMLAFETTQQYHNKGPLWEFLRHCRNAVAHNCRFQFNLGEPRFPAEWGSIHIKATMQSNPLFRIDKNTPGFLEPGDIIKLLWDIEQAYPNMVVS